jgi:hypothetical protein
LSPRIVPIVEGHGEVDAIPVLLRRLFMDWDRHDLLNEIGKPQRKKRTKITKLGELENEIAFAATEEGCEAILVIIDADDDCAAELGPALLKRSRKARADIKIIVALAVREYESWLIAGLSSLVTRGKLPQGVKPPENIESIRGAKEWLEDKMGRAYQETVDQASFTATFNIEEASKHSRSFRHFIKAVKNIVDKLPEKK